MKFRETLFFAYIIGFWERLRYGDAFGRTHETRQDWNESYDRGANLADKLKGGTE